MNQTLRAWFLIVFGISALAISAAHTRADGTMKIYLMAGQSNMEGQAYTWDFNLTVSTWNVPTLQYLHESPAYLDSLPDNIYTFKSGFSDAYFDPRNDVWAVQYDSASGTVREVRNIPDPTPNDKSTPIWPKGIQPLSPGFGPSATFGEYNASMFGVELAMGHRLGDALDDPILLFKSNRGGTTLAVDWRPPSAVEARGGTIGVNYTNTINQFKALLDELDVDLADNGVLDNFNGATGYEVVGFVWLQGWNEVTGSDVPQKIAEYADNLVDLVNDIRAADDRIPVDLPAIIVESSDQNVQLNAQRQAAVDALNLLHPGSAVFIETNGLVGVNYGGLNSFGELFSDGWGYHFHARPENFLQMGWLIGEAILENGYVGTVVPEPASFILLTIGGVWLTHRRNRR